MSVTEMSRDTLIFEISKQKYAKVMDKKFACTLGRRKTVVGVARFELANEGVKVPCLTAWRHPNKSGYKYGGYKYPVVRLKGFEPLTPALEGRCSIQLSYKRIGAGDENRTHVTSLEG